MKKFVTILALCLVIVFCAIGFSACGNENNSASESDIKKVYNLYVVYAEENGASPLSYEEWLQSIKGNTTNQNTGKEKHEIELTRENYWRYFDVETSNVNYTPPFVFKGCLTYALYDNVCVYFECVSESKTETYEVKLKANGEGFMPFMRSTTVRLLDISGKVIFWM